MSDGICGRARIGGSAVDAAKLKKSLLYIALSLETFRFTHVGGAIKQISDDPNFGL